MRITLLGSGDAMGMPVPLCDCEYCQKSKKRRRPSLLVDQDDTTVVIEMSPDVKEQLHETGVHDVDAFFATHHHYDHFSGIRELNHIAIDEHILNTEEFDYQGWHGREIEVYGNNVVRRHLEDMYSHIAENDNIIFQNLGFSDSVSVGGIDIKAFEVEHAEKTQGYVIQGDNRKVVYAPDVRKIPSDVNCYEDADLALMEGSLFGAETHGYTEEIEESINRVGADRTVLVNISEHLNQMHTEDMERVAEQNGFELWDDFDSVQMN